MVNVSLTYAAFTVESSALPENSIEHLLRLGFSTAIKNSIAGVKAGVLGNGATPWSDDDIKTEAERIGLTAFGRDEATAKAICDAMQADMFESIVSGKTRAPRASAARISPDDKLRRDIAIELLEKWAKEKGKALPKRTKPEEKAAFEDLLAKASEKWAATIEKEFKARRAKKFDLDDLGL
jgi:hypothetical protein